MLLAACGLERLGLEAEIGFRLPVDRFVPEVGQGVVVLQTRRGEEGVAAALDDADARAALMAERAAVARLGGGCTAPVAAHAAREAGGWSVRAWVGEPDGGASLSDDASGRGPVGRRGGGRRPPAAPGRGGAARGSARMTVYLVGAGPGDPGLITARGLDLVRRAEVLVYDRLAGARLVAEAPPGCLLLDAGKAPGRQAMTQEETNAALVEHGRTGPDAWCASRAATRSCSAAAPRRPRRCARPACRTRSCRASRRPSPSPAYAGIPVTHRGVATRFTVVTGHEDPTKGAADVDWAALARAGGTLVILMGVGRLGEIADALVAGGRDAATPVAVIRDGTLGSQETVTGTLATIATDAAARAPAGGRRRGRRRRAARDHRVGRAAAAARRDGRRDARAGPGARAGGTAGGARARGCSRRR